MKLKGVGFFEAHVEKLLLGLMVAVAAGVVVLQFTSTNEVEIGNQKLPPARAYDPVVRRAQEVDGQLKSTNPNIPEVEDRTQALAGVEDRVRGAVSVRPEIMAFGKPAQIDEALFKGQAEDVEYAVVTPPAPSTPIVASYAGTLDPGLVAGNEALSTIVGPAQPFDLATVSVEVTYDGTALEEAFRSGGQGDIRPIPFNWFRSVEALGLQLERQEQLAGDRWSESTVINGLPGRQSLFEVLQTEAAAGTLGRDQLAADARVAYEQAIDYRRPLTLRTIAGTQWNPPAVVKQEMAAQGGADNQVRANQINRQLASERRTLGGIDEQLQDSGRGGGQDDRGPRGPGRPGRPGVDPPSTTPDDPRTQRLRDRKAEVERRIAQLEEDLIDLGYDPQTGQALAQAGFEDTTVDARLLEDSQARLWAHDATAQAGKTYRYRTRLVVNNPLYGREPVLVEAQRPLAASPVVFSEPSPWSDPVVVAPKTAFFLTSASDGRGGALGPSEPSASIEVYTFYYGYYRRSTLTLRPGDLVAAEADLPDDLRLPVLAVADEGGRAPAAEPRPGPRSGAPTGAQPTGRPGDAGEQGQEAGQGEPVPDKVPATMEVYLVDVTFEPTQAEGLGDRTSQAVAYFSRIDGDGLLRRVASNDRQGVLYQMLSRSAEEGRTQGQPRESLEQVETRPRDREERPTGAQPAGGGKGAGGGGGG